MKFPDLRSFLKALEERDELLRVPQELSPRYEAASAIRMSARRSGKAVLLEHISGYRVPVVGNLLGSNRRLALSLGVKEEDIADAYLKGRNNPVKPRIVDSAPVQETVLKGNIDILKAMPVLTHSQKDAGPYLTCAFVVAKDPETGVRGLGIHRIQIKGKDRVDIFLGSPPLSDFLARADAAGSPMEIAIVSGPDPVTYFASPQAAPPGVDKYDIAGGLAGAPLELVRCKSVDVEVPAHAEFVLEGRTIPRRREEEGPFGESTGYYLTYNNPVAVIEVITHRRDPVYHALAPFGPEEPVLQAPRMQTDTLVWLQGIVPPVRQVHSPALGVVYVQIDKKSDDEPAAIIRELFARPAAPYAKLIVVVDADVDITDPGEIAWALGSRVRPDRDITIKGDLPGLIIDPSTTGSEEVTERSQLRTRTAKVGIDATKPLAELDKFEKIDQPAEVNEKVARMLGLL